MDEQVTRTSERTGREGGCQIHMLKKLVINLFSILGIAGALVFIGLFKLCDHLDEPTHS